MKQAFILLPLLALLAVGAMIVAQLTATARFRVYALLLVVASAVTIAMQWGPAFPMLSGGGTVTLWSLLLVVRFLRATADFDERAT